ncbi:hypothetical protein Salat_2434000, partial [Sesamum alatum]
MISPSLAPAGKDFSYADVLQGFTPLKSNTSYASSLATTGDFSEHGHPLADCTPPSHSEHLLGSAHSLPASSSLTCAEGNNAPPPSYVLDPPINIDEKIAPVSSVIPKQLIN